MTEVEIRQDERARVLGEVAARLFGRARDRETAAALTEGDLDDESGPWNAEARALREFAEILCRERTGPRSRCGHISAWRADVGLCAHPDCRCQRGEGGTAPAALEEIVRRCVDRLPSGTPVDIARDLVDAVRDAWALGRGEATAPAPPAPEPVIEAGGRPW